MRELGVCDSIKISNCLPSKKMSEVFDGFVDRCELAIIGAVILLGWSEFFFRKKLAVSMNLSIVLEPRPSQNLMRLLLNVFSCLQTGELVTWPWLVLP